MLSNPAPTPASKASKTRLALDPSNRESPGPLSHPSHLIRSTHSLTYKPPLCLSVSCAASFLRRRGPSRYLSSYLALPFSSGWIQIPLRQSPCRIGPPISFHPSSTFHYLRGRSRNNNDSPYNHHRHLGTLQRRRDQQPSQPRHHCPGPVIRQICIDARHINICCITPLSSGAYILSGATLSLLLAFLPC